MALKGFLLSRQWHERNNQQELIYWAATSAGPAKLIFRHQESVCFVASEDLPAVVKLLAGVKFRYAEIALKGFHQQAMTACYFSGQRELNVARQKLAGSITLYESDLRPTDRFLMERFITAGILIDGDFETRAGYRRYEEPKIRPAEYTPALKVISLDIETSYTENILYSIAVSGDNLEKVFMVGNETTAHDYVEMLPDETAVIRSFLHWLEVYDPDVVIGWSVVGFDLKFLQDRCDQLRIPFLLGRGKQAIAWRTNQQRGNRHYALVPGRVVLDGIELLRTATYQFESFALDNVARQMLGRGKLIDDVDDRGNEIQQLFVNDKDQLAAYNLEDCKLVLEIFDHANLISFALERSRLTGLDLDRAGGSVAAFDFLYLPKLHRQGYVAPVIDESLPVGSPGGYVLDSKPGLYDHVIVLDFKSLYPSIIRTFHVDPLAMIEGAAEAELGESTIPGFKDAQFSRTKKILPEIIEQLWAARDVAKRDGAAAMSQAIKIIMNSFYGVLGTPGCRFFHPALVSSITLRGHEILQKTRDLIEDKGYSVIYGDTDSVFVWLRDVSDGDQANEIGQSLMVYLNDWWREHLKESFNLESCLEVEYETHYQRFLMPRIRGSEKGSKKRYAGMVGEMDNPRLVIKGLESVRSDWSPVARQFQQALFKKVFCNEPYHDFIKETVTAVLAGHHDEDLVLRKRLRRNLDDYQKNVPPHVRAARFADQVRQEQGLDSRYQYGGWIEYVMTVNGAEPKRYRRSKLDYDFYIDKQLAPIADAILCFNNESLGKLLDKQMGLF